MTKKVEIGIRVDKSGATRGYNQFTKDVTSSNKKIRSELEKTKAASAGLGMGIKTLIGAAGGLLIFNKVNNLFKESIQLAGEQARAVAKVEQTIASTGGAAGLTADELKKMASEFQNVTTFGDEVTLRGQAMLLTFKKIGKDIFPAATEAMLNLSVAMEGDVKEASIQLGKALNDPITGLTALRRVGITFSAEQENIIKNFQKTGDIASAQKLILQELESQFGGLAKAVALTGEGKLMIFQNIVSDVKEKLGDALIPVLLDSIKGFQDFLIEGQKTGQIQKTFRGIANGVRVMFAVISDIWRGLKAIFNFWAAGWAKIAQGAFSAVEAVAGALGRLNKFLGFDEVAKNNQKTAESFRNMAEAAKITADELFQEGLFSVEGGSAIVNTFKKITSGAQEAKKEIEEVKGAAGLGGVEGGVATDPKAAAAAKKKADQEEKERQQTLEAARRVQDELAILREEGFTAELEKIRQWEEEKKNILIAAGQDTADLEKVANNKRLEAFREMNEAELEIEKEKNEKIKATQMQLVATRRAALGDFISNLQSMAQANKAFGALYQISAISQTTIDTFKAAQGAYSALAGIPIVGPALGIAAAAAATGAGLVRIANIKKQKFQAGGVVQSGQLTGDRSSVLANKGEMFLNAVQQRNLLALANGRGGNGGGNTISFGQVVINAPGGNADEIATAVNRTRQEQIRAASELLNEKDALLVT